LDSSEVQACSRHRAGVLHFFPTLTAGRPPTPPTDTPGLATTVVISGTWSGGITLMDAVVNQLKIDVHRRRVCLLAYFPAQAFAAS